MCAVDSVWFLLERIEACDVAGLLVLDMNLKAGSGVLIYDLWQEGKVRYVRYVALL
jgi:hypothetical protein